MSSNHSDMLPTFFNISMNNEKTEQLTNVYTNSSQEQLVHSIQPHQYHLPQIILIYTNNNSTPLPSIEPARAYNESNSSGMITNPFSNNACPFLTQIETYHVNGQNHSMEGLIESTNSPGKLSTGCF
jgi:hypothetical protein